MILRPVVTGNTITKLGYGKVRETRYPHRSGLDLMSRRTRLFFDIWENRQHRTKCITVCNQSHKT